MSNELTPQNPKPDSDDGFGGSFNNSSRRGTFVRWTEALDWQDRDGLKPPSPMLVVAIDEGLQRWKDKVPTLIIEKPLPDPEQLNADIPLTEWEKGLDGQPVPPWQHIVIVLLVNVATGELYKYVSPTAGAHIAFDLLKESVITMRALRGARVLPLINLTKRQMKTKFGLKMRPHFEIVGWKTPGGDAAIASEPPRQIPGPETAATPTPTTPEPATPAVSAAASAPPAPSTSAQSRESKRSIPFSESTLAVMGEPKPVTTAEYLNDSLDDLWD